MFIDELIKFCKRKSENIKLKAEPQVFIEIAEKLEELKIYKDLEEQGLLVKLPCPLGTAHNVVFDMVIEALKKQIPKKVYHFIDYDTFVTSCCGVDVTNKDYNYCPNCGCLLGEVEELKGE